MGWRTTFPDLTMPIFEVQKIDVLGGGPLFETSRCQFVKAPKSMCLVGNHFSRPHDANFSSQIDCLGGGPLSET